MSKTRKSQQKISKRMRVQAHNKMHEQLNQDERVPSNIFKNRKW